MKNDDFMRRALALARRGYGTTSPNPMVGAVLVKHGKIIGQGWHRRAGMPHAEIEAIGAARQRGKDPRGATLHVTLEPCCTRGRTPPCTDAIIAAGIAKVVVGAMDPNPKHSGRAFELLRRGGIEVARGILAEDCARLNEAFNHWIVHRRPFVTVKAAMTLDGRIATSGGESKWITGTRARAVGMKLRQGADAVLVGVNTVLADDPALTFRPASTAQARGRPKPLRRFILDTMARTPLNAKVISDEFAALTTIVVSPAAPNSRVSALKKRVTVLVAPILEGGARTRVAPGVLRTTRRPVFDLPRLLARLGSENVTHLLVEGGGETNAFFLLGRQAQRVVFFYAPRILGGITARKAVAGDGVKNLSDAIQLQDMDWRRIGEDLMMTARVAA
ncbi:MAG: bifunctional diaminohydroxyphosphoribosylaminopyrimidine deaminase/5-amino-6-(5-phosphoribosylamino)uracil reductase RibD [Limisphaerales bacterium]